MQRRPPWPFAQDDTGTLAHPHVPENRMNPARRLLLRGALPGATLSIALAAGLLRPATVLAGPANQSIRPQMGLAANELLQALRTAQPAQSTEIRIIAPDIAEDGASVFLECSTTLPEVDGFVIFAERNPQPLVASFWIAPDVLPELKTRIKLSRTSNVWVVVRSRGQFYKASKMVKVTVGGCGVGLN